jgi:hypothetical protein
MISLLNLRAWLSRLLRHVSSSSSLHYIVDCVLFSNEKYFCGVQGRGHSALGHSPVVRNVQDRKSKCKKSILLSGDEVTMLTRELLEEAVCDEAGC